MHQSISIATAVSYGISYAGKLIIAMCSYDNKTEAGAKFSVFLSLLLATLSRMQPDLQNPETLPKSVPVEHLLDVYDFVIIGSGSGGSVVANRLSEIGHWKVLLIEAGENAKIISQVPAFTRGFLGPGVDWNYSIEPQKNSYHAYKNNQGHYARGKALGGCTVINGLMYMRGDPKCFDEWERMGNKGWGYENVLKYFKKAENNTNPYMAEKNYHGTDGPLTVSDLNYSSEITNAFFRAAKEHGINDKDLNGESGEGCMKLQTTTRDGKRCSAAKAYLDEIRNRSNIHFTMNSTVTKILINEHTNFAYGVRFLRDNKEYVVYVMKEIILAAGAINSPQILMLSGVGPENHLTKYKIPVIVNSPVGQNAMDHVAYFGLVLTVSPNVSIDLEKLGNDDIIKYATNSTGYLSVGNCQAIAMIKTKYADDDIPDLQIYFSSTKAVTDSKTISDLLGLKEDFYERAYGTLNREETISIVQSLNRPRSLGYVQLKSSNPLEAPAFDPRYFTNDRDIKVLIEGINISLALAKNKSFQKYGVRYPNNTYAECSSQPYLSEEYWDCAIRQYPTSFLHVTSSCKMGTNPTTSVVDARLRVHGINGLRVIDGSIMPIGVNANPNAATIMIGEKGSDLIKEDWGQLFEDDF